MNYYKLTYDYWKDKKWVKVEAQNNLEGFNRYDLDKGIELNQWNERFRFSYNPKEGKEFTDFLGNNLGWFIISQKLKDIISTLQPTNIQYLPITVVNMKTNEINDSYSVVNLTENIEALDLENSVCDEWEIDETRKMLAIQMHCINESKAIGKHIFRLKEDNTPIFVSESLKSTIEESSLIGCSFMKVRTSK